MRLKTAREEDIIYAILTVQDMVTMNIGKK